MNAFTKRSLVTALAAAGSLGIAGAANAVNVNHDGLGNVLIYPYYTVNNDPNGNAWATLLSVTNTTASAKSVKIRFREALNSWEVLDFNIFLSPNDVWTAAVTAAASGGAQVATGDKSCTIPSAVVNVPFRSTAYQSDGGSTSITRTAEGYFEIFEMATYTAASVTGKAVTHVNGVPPCGANVNDTQAANDALATNGGLFGTVVLVNASSGGAFTQNATALDNFGPVGYFTTGSTLPDYTNATATSNQISGGSYYRTTWAGNGANAVTAVLQADNVINEYALDASTSSATNWIVTHPTKYIYVNGVGAPFAPFTVAWDTTAGKACEPVVVNEYDREERNNVSQDFSPAAGGTKVCYEANVIGFSSANLFGSKTFVNVNAPFANGWASLGFTAAGQKQVSPAGVVQVVLGSGTINNPMLVPATWYGLPVIGFAAETFNNNNLTIGGVVTRASFGSETRHRQSPAVR